MKAKEIVEKDFWKMALAAATVFLGFLQGCGEKKGQEASEAVSADRPLEVYRIELLDTAFRAASAFPKDPHIKTRSRLQQAVVETCLELGQATRALDYSQQIDDWRRGYCFAAVAAHQAENGRKESADYYLKLAADIAEGAGLDPVGQEWRRDRIRAEIARALLLLERPLEAEKWSTGLVESETSKWIEAKAKLAGPGRQVGQIDEARLLIAKGSLEQLNAALTILSVQFGAALQDSDRRQAIEDLIEEGSRKIPLTMRLDTCITLASTAIEGGFPALGVKWVNKGSALLEKEVLPPEYRIPFLARLAIQQGKAVGTTQAKRVLDSTLEEYSRDRTSIVDIYRARTLRPIAEAYHSLGFKEIAAATYKQAIEEGASNPNSRPRAEDLAATIQPRINFET